MSGGSFRQHLAAYTTGIVQAEQQDHVRPSYKMNDHLYISLRRQLGECSSIEWQAGNSGVPIYTYI